MTDRSTVIVRTVTRTVVPLIIVTAIALLLRGHNLPGGGFIAGVLTVTALALVYVIYGQAFVQHDLLGLSADVNGPITEAGDRYGVTYAVGLAVAAGSGLVAVAAGAPFLTQGVLFLKHVPVYGEFEIASALAFDVGVYLVVVGALLTVLSVVGTE